MNDSITIPISAFAYILSLDPTVFARGAEESLDLSVATADDVLAAACEAFRDAGREDLAEHIEKVMESFT